MTTDIIELVDNKLSEQQWSSEQISGWLLKEKAIAISHERIYQHIWDDKRQGGDLVTIVERKTLYTLVVRVNGKRADWVTQATIQLLKPFKDGLHSITADNGKDFSHHEQISKELDTAFYFAHPYSSWERGLNENTNGLIRQYFPKKTDFKTVTDEEIYSVMEKLNNRPERALTFEHLYRQ